MTDRPILFSAPMVQALLAGRKTQTRRILPNPEYYGCPTGDCPHSHQDECNKAMVENTAADLRYAVGDRLYVREEYYQRGHWWEDATDLTAKGKPKWKFAAYDHDITFDAPTKFLKARSRSNPSKVQWYKRLGRFMPRRYSRLTLTVTDVRVERLQDCSEADAMAEGVRRIFPEGSRNDTGPYHFTVPIQHGSLNERSAKATYELLWNVINGDGAWEANPWVVAVSFDVRQGNIDA